MRRFGGVLSLLFALLWLPLGAQIEKPSLVETEWLAQHLNHPNLRIIDARADLPAYLQGHIPGAIYLHAETLRLSRGGIPGQLLPPERLAEIFGQLGIDNQTTVVVYSSSADNFTMATTVVFALVYLGHDRVAVLNGGWEKWQAENRPVSRDIPKVPVVSFVPNPRPELIRTANDVAKLIESPDSFEVIDARPTAMYQAGHIPTAQNLPLTEFLQSDGKVAVWLKPEAIREKLRAAGIDTQRPVVTYCASGRMSSLTWFTLKYLLGVDATLYEGSWVDWVANGQRVEK